MRYSAISYAPFRRAVSFFSTRGENSGWQAVGSWTVTAAAGGGALTSYPENGATNVPYNTRVILSLPTPVNPATVTASTVNVFRGESPVSVQRVVSADGRYISLQAAPSSYPQSSTLSVVANGLYDQAGAALAPYQATTPISATVLATLKSSCDSPGRRALD